MLGLRVFLLSDDWMEDVLGKCFSHCKPREKEKQVKLNSITIMYMCAYVGQHVQESDVHQFTSLIYPKYAQKHSIRLQISIFDVVCVSADKPGEPVCVHST